MKLYFIRHGDPDYLIDSLTENGVIEAKLLKERIAKLNLDGAFVSPLGRAALTAKIALEKTNIVPVEYDWLREFDAPVEKPHSGKTGVMWDLLPSYYAENKQLQGENWLEAPLVTNSTVGERYSYVTRGFDELISSLGYAHSGQVYRAEKPNDKSFAFFCHFGVESVILSHIFGISPFILLQDFCALPTSVTMLATEERRQGIAAFRCLYFGDISHLYAADRKPSFSARFCERFTDDTRHD